MVIFGLDPLLQDTLHGFATRLAEEKPVRNLGEHLLVFTEIMLPDQCNLRSCNVTSKKLDLYIVKQLLTCLHG